TTHRSSPARISIRSILSSAGSEARRTTDTGRCLTTRLAPGTGSFQVQTTGLPMPSVWATCGFSATTPLRSTTARDLPRRPRWRWNTSTGSSTASPSTDRMSCSGMWGTSPTALGPRSEAIGSAPTWSRLTGRDPRPLLGSLRAGLASGGSVGAGRFQNCRELRLLSQPQQALLGVEALHVRLVGGLVGQDILDARLDPIDGVVD